MWGSNGRECDSISINFGRLFGERKERKRIIYNLQKDKRPSARTDRNEGIPDLRGILVFHFACGNILVIKFGSFLIFQIFCRGVYPKIEI